MAGLEGEAVKGALEKIGFKSEQPGPPGSPAKLPVTKHVVECLEKLLYEKKALYVSDGGQVEIK